MQVAQSISYTAARNRLKELIDQVTLHHEAVRIERRNGEHAVILSADDFAGLQETRYLLGSPPNAERLLAAKRRGADQAIAWEEAKGRLAP